MDNSEIERSQAEDWQDRMWSSMGINCACGIESCISSAVITHDDYLIIREYHNDEHHIASIKLSAKLANAIMELKELT